MSSVQIPYMPNEHATIRFASLSAIIDDAITNQVGVHLVRTPGGWNPSPFRMEVVNLAGVASTSGGGIATWQPAGGFNVIVTRCIIWVAVPSSGAANLTVGVGASATTSYTNLITATSVASAGIIDSITNQTAASAAVALLMAPGQYVTFSGSATTAGLVGKAMLEYYATTN